jgi:hypothetical protein
MDENGGRAALDAAAPDEQPETDVRSFTPENRLGLLTAGEVTVSDDGVLDVRKGSRTFRFDLYDTATEVAVHGKPTSRRWRVEFRNAEHAVAVDAKMVDAEAFTRELQRWRPEAI